MTTNIETLAATMFSSNLELALQQTVAKLAPYAIQQAASGRLQQINNLVQPKLPREKRGRLEALVPTGSQYSQRFVHKPNDTYYEDTVDKDDDLVSLVDIQGGQTRSASATLQRAKDMAWLKGFYGVNYVGQYGLTPVNFDAANIVPVDTGAASSAPTGMNVPKLRAAQKLLRARHVDVESEECFMALSAEQIADLQGEIQATSYEFNRHDQPVMRDGKLGRLLGFNFISVQFGDATSFGDEVAALTLDSSGHRRVPFWCRSGMAMGTWVDHFSSIDVLPQLHYARQVYAMNCQAGTRTDEAKCGQVLCLESA